MNTADTRYRNILALLRGYEHDSRFAIAADISTSYLSQIKTRARNLGEKTARRIEANLGLEIGALDDPDAFVGQSQDAIEGSARDLEHPHTQATEPLGSAPSGPDELRWHRHPIRWRNSRRSLPSQIKEAEQAKYDLIQDLIKSDMTAEQVDDIHRYFKYISN